MTNPSPITGFNTRTALNDFLNDPKFKGCWGRYPLRKNKLYCLLKCKKYKRCIKMVDPGMLILTAYPIISLVNTLNYVHSKKVGDLIAATVMLIGAVVIYLLEKKSVNKEEAREIQKEEQWMQKK